MVGHHFFAITPVAPAVTEDVCSLRSDVERLAFYVIWEMTPEADIISTRYVKSVIKSATTLSYVEAQARMDDSRLMDPVTTDLRNMNSLASDAVRFKTAHVPYVVAVCDALQLMSFSSPMCRRCCIIRLQVMTVLLGNVLWPRCCSCT